MKKASLALGLLLLSAVTLTSCTRLRVDSNIPGARVVWSPDGTEPYRDWPPNSWEMGSRRKEATTPFRAMGSYGDALFITVEKDGYLRPLPQLVQLYALRRERLNFNLIELPETTARRMEAMGLVLYNGEWVDPEEAGLVVYNGVVMPKEEAFRKEQIAKGLVEFNGEWMTEAEAAEAFRQERLAAGFVLFKDRWVMPEVRDAETAIDELVTEIRESKDYPDLPTPRVLGSQPYEGVQIQLYNSTGQRIRILLSGPVSREYFLDPYRSTGVRAGEQILIPAGRYDIAIIPTGVDASGRDLREAIGGEKLDIADAIQLSQARLWGSWPLSEFTQYSVNYIGSDQDLQETLQNYQIPEANIEVTPPRIDTPVIERPAPPQRPENGERRQRPEGFVPPGGAGGPAGGGQRPAGGGQRPQAAPAAPAP